MQGQTWQAPGDIHLPIELLSPPHISDRVLAWWLLNRDPNGKSWAPRGVGWGRAWGGERAEATPSLPLGGLAH